MKPIPWATTTLILITITLNAILTQITAFPLQDYYFNPLDPFNHFGLNLLSSLFLHHSSTHLIVNLCGLILFQHFIKNSISQKYILMIILLGHFLTLMCLALTHFTLNPAGHHLYLGLSTSVYTLISFAIFTKERKVFVIFLLVFVFSDLWSLYVGNYQSIWPKLSHFYAAAIGLGFGFYLRDSARKAKGGPDVARM